MPHPTKKNPHQHRVQQKKQQLDAEFLRPELNWHNIEHLSRDLHAAATAANQHHAKRN